MFNLPLEKQQYHAPLTTIIIAVVLFFIGSFVHSSLDDALVYTRVGVEQGEWWRFITGNWLHSNAYHLVLNCAGIFLLWALHGDYYSTGHYHLMLFCFCLAVTVSLYFYDPSMSSYVGLSGALHGLFVWGAYHDIRHGLKSGWLLLLGIGIKIVNEQISEPNESLAGLIDARVAIDAHLFGALIGVVWVLVAYLGQRYRHT